MASATDTAATQPPTPRPSIFISYASEDRAAARVLRDALLAGGLEVWYDEQELGGGDAWDQKIRRQIRDCEYFMPLISAATQARKEGYFRREWRLATERTLDMADDVLFLVPVSIDETTEAGARVPDKFLHVQWLRLPGGQPTPALEALVRRMLAGDHHALTRAPFGTGRPAYSHTPNPAPTPAAFSGATIPPLTAPPPLAGSGAGPAASATPPPRPSASHPAPPPMPPFPHIPEKGGFLHGIKFIAEVLWWALTAGWLIFNRLPKFFRIILTIWAIAMLFGKCGKEQSAEIRTDRPPKENAERPASKASKKGDFRKIMEDVAAGFADAQRDAEKNGTKADFTKVSRDIARALAQQAGADNAMGKPLLLVPFALDLENEAAAKFATAVFTSTYGHILVARPRVAAIAERLPPAATEDMMIAAAHKHGANWVLRALPAAGDGPPALTVRLLRVDDATVAWTATFALEGTEPSEAADKISEQVLEVLPSRPITPPPLPPKN